jgi:hypothetical protein
MPTGDGDLLSRFQRLGDREALIAHGRSLGYPEARLRAAVDQLQPVFASLNFGEQPLYENLDRDPLGGLQPEISFVVRSMAESEAADLRTAGFHVMGVMDWQPFIPTLQEALESGREWERIEAARALARMSHPKVRAILEAARRDPKPVVRNAVREALEGFDRRRLP